MYLVMQKKLRFLPIMYILALKKLTAIAEIFVFC